MSKIKWIRYAIPALMIVAGVVSLPAALPIFSPEREATFMKRFSTLPGLQGILRWEDGNYYALPQDYADMIGWEELGQKAGEIWQSIPDKSRAAIYADSYGQAGAIEHFGKSYGVTDVLSFSESYQYWLPDSISSDFQTLIYVNGELGDDMPGFFTQIEKVFELDMPLSRQHGDKIYLCTGPTPAFFERIGTAIRQAKLDEEIED